MGIFPTAAVEGLERPFLTVCGAIEKGQGIRFPCPLLFASDDLPGCPDPRPDPLPPWLLRLILHRDGLSLFCRSLRWFIWFRGREPLHGCQGIRFNGVVQLSPEEIPFIGYRFCLELCQLCPVALLCNLVAQIIERRLQLFHL